MKVLYICVIYLICYCTSTGRSQCISSAKDGSVSQQHLERLKPLEGKTFKYTYKDEEDKDQYQYTLSICSAIDGRNDFAGVVQKGVDNGLFKVVGRINATSIKAGKDWIMLTYKSGDAYHSHCKPAGQTNAVSRRQANIMISCDPNELEGKFTVLYEENKEVSENGCFYMMELETSAVCSTTQTGLSTGSILAIILLSVAAAYLLLGMTYKRCVHGEKGISQVPNINFWKTCGALQADGCDFLCRCQDTGFSSSRPYHGIADDQLDDDGDDEHLLPM